MNKIPTGWSEPIPLSDVINSLNGIILQLSVDAKGNLYFGVTKGSMNYRIYCSEYKDGIYHTPELFKPLDGVNAYNPYVSPDGSYLIYYKIDGGGGIWIIFKKNDGAWTSGINIGEILGFPYASSAAVTPDGRYLIFLSGTAQYWADASFIEELRKKELLEVGKPTKISN